MFPDSPQPEFSVSGSKPGVAPQPSDEDVVRALVEIQKATTTTPPSSDSPIHLVAERSWGTGSRRWLAFAAGVAIAASLGYATKRQSPSGKRAVNGAIVRNVSSSAQAEVEQVLGRVAAGDSAAADEMLARSAEWTGKTHRTPRSEQLVSTALNLPDLHLRAAGVQAELALDGIPVNETGLTQVKQAVGNPQQRVWALWMIGALGNRGVDPDHSTKILGAYLADPNVQVRAAAVDALALVATEETIPMLLDQFRNDPSPVVEERAACGLAESGMYTREQRMTAAASFVGWVDDALLSSQQQAWTVQALGDISGKRLGNDSAAWRSWYEGAR
jgi:hypothetical protein